MKVIKLPRASVAIPADQLQSKDCRVVHQAVADAVKHLEVEINRAISKGARAIQLRHWLTYKYQDGRTISMDIQTGGHNERVETTIDVTGFTSDGPPYDARSILAQYQQQVAEEMNDQWVALAESGEENLKARLNTES